MNLAMGSVSYDFTGDVVLITGAARGLGRDFALSFARAGARVAVNDLAGRDLGDGVPYETGTAGDLDKTVADAQALGAEVLAVPGDVTSEAHVSAMVDAVVERFGRLDILVNNAGVHSGAKAWEMTEAQWDAVVDVDLKAPWLCSKHAARHMVGREGGGRIITISSTSGLVGIPDQVNYQSAKHGVIGQIRTLALELAPHDVTVNAICPTVVSSPMLDHLVETGAAYFQEVARLCGASTVFPGLDNLEPVDVSHAVQWLASDAARYVTGIALPVDGGFTCK
ncbi:SDR family oxidoreductase [Capillimicrobium parvum]|uniref:(-)-trans-carveol dehydrogenase n=1 Tax=Capillimicrobium parvum TaxID=2884022 RepID=A0A9E7BYU4_9ACTN|nr:SDR family oxidoreductase [Capillimicrobium parvum]UGS33822.1 (-)-trans-carveol dehydrogenase [Capillimicrobium parvum]